MLDDLSDKKFLFVGEFNAITNLKEKKGGILPPQRAMEDFATFIRDNALMDIIPQNGSFT